MKIKRATKSFRTGSSVPGSRGAHEGELFPESHPLVKRRPMHFEDVEDYVERKFPELYGRQRRSRGLLGRAKTRQSEPRPEPGPEPQLEVEQSPEPAKPGLKRPPASGPGSGVDAWRAYAAAATDSPLGSWTALSRDDIIELLDSEGVNDG